MPKLGANPLWESVMDFIIRFKSEHDGVAPSVQEICDACGLQSKSHADYILTRLEDEGRIRRNEKEARMIMVPGGQWTLRAEGA
jgi:SOS-response transcriptional repressor LexA